MGNQNDRQFIVKMGTPIKLEPVVKAAELQSAILRAMREMPARAAALTQKNAVAELSEAQQQLAPYYTQAGNAVRIASQNIIRQSDTPVPSPEQIRQHGGGVEGYIRAISTLRREGK